MSPIQTRNSSCAGTPGTEGLVLSGSRLSTTTTSPPITRLTLGKVMGSRVKPGVTMVFTLGGTKVMPVSGIRVPLHDNGDCFHSEIGTTVVNQHEVRVDRAAADFGCDHAGCT